jgi:hypothetical protein
MQLHKSGQSKGAPRRTEADKLARGLGWFSIGLGLAEVFATRQMTKSLGMRGQEDLVRACGVRELVAGAGILGRNKRSPWLWSRVAGDAIDITVLALNAHAGNPKRRNVAIALGSVAAVTALDVITAKAETSHERRESAPLFDYSDRSGFAKSPDEMRGAARDFSTPRDMAAPDALQPLNKNSAARSMQMPISS